MLMPSIFNDNLFDDFFDFPFYDNKADRKIQRKLYGHHAGNLMKTDIKEKKDGYDLELTKIISDNVSIPVIASGGAGKLEHFRDAFTEAGADAVLAASLFHYKELEIREVKEYLRDQGISVRL